MKGEIILGRIFLVVLVTSICFLAIDFVSTRFISSRSAFEEMFPVNIARYPKPYVMFGGKPHANVFNRLGYRGDFPVVQKSVNEYRVFMLGGSTVLNGRPPLPVLLEKEFAQNGMSNVKVYNFGVVASVSNMEIARIVFEISELHPDLIVMYNGGNDFLMPWYYDPRPGYPCNFIAYEANPILESDVKKYPTLPLFFYGSNIFRYLFSSYFMKKFVNLDQVRKNAGYLSEEWGNQIAKRYVSNLVKAERLSRTFNSDFIAFFQPMIQFKKQLSREEKKYYFKYEKFPNMMRKQIQIEMNKAGKISQAKMIDLSGIYNGVTKWVFTDNIHTRQWSKDIVTREIYHQIMYHYASKINKR